jgi:hypothetical protein
MKTKIFTLAYLALASLALISVTGCQDDSGDPCSGVVCLDGQVCAGGTCVVLDPCGGCPDGQVCLNGVCTDLQSCVDVNCPVGQECVNGTCVAITPVTKSGILTTNETWTNDRIFFLANKVVVPSGLTLTIEAGTIIKGKEGSGSLATGLIIARGAKIEANGTKDQPIIFTSELDNIQVGQKTGTNLTASDNSKWGGVIVLGHAKISAEDGDTEAQIEGIPANELYGRYGGSNDADNSGVIRYVSIRHGGAEIGAGNEINGLTLGGVGNATVIDHIEIVGNLDDGIECFGGSVNINNAAVIYQGDDAIDLDQNYSGTIKNFVVVMGGGDGDEGLEIDGPENSTYTTGKFSLENGTIKTEDGTHSGSDFKSKAQGRVIDCVFTGFADGKTVKIRESFDKDNSCADKTDALDRLRTGDLFLQGCEVVSSTASITDFANAYTDVDECAASLTAATQTEVDTKIMETSNMIVTTATKGANMTEFADWTWGSINGKL